MSYQSKKNAQLRANLLGENPYPPPTNKHQRPIAPPQQNLQHPQPHRQVQQPIAQQGYSQQRPHSPQQERSFISHPLQSAPTYNQQPMYQDQLQPYQQDPYTSQSEKLRPQQQQQQPTNAPNANYPPNGGSKQPYPGHGTRSSFPTEQVPYNGNSQPQVPRSQGHQYRSYSQTDQQDYGQPQKYSQPPPQAQIQSHPHPHPHHHQQHQQVPQQQYSQKGPTRRQSNQLYTHSSQHQPQPQHQYQEFNNKPPPPPIHYQYAEPEFSKPMANRSASSSSSTSSLNPSQVRPGSRHASNSHESIKSNPLPIEDDRINYLEEKIEKLTKMLELQELHRKNESNGSFSTSGSNTSTPTNENSQFVSNQNSSSSSNQTNKEALVTPAMTSTTTNEPIDPIELKVKSAKNEFAPPLPPPPPADQKSNSSSPRVNSFLSTNRADEARRESNNSLIPNEDQLFAYYMDDTDDDFLTGNTSTNEDNNNDELPPPSYEELEKSGTLTYSKSIYRTGFEKAGFNLDHVPKPAQASSLSSSLNADLSNPEANIGSENCNPVEKLKSKRKLPPPLPSLNEEVKEHFIYENPVSSRLASESSVGSSVYSERNGSNNSVNDNNNTYNIINRTNSTIDQPSAQSLRASGSNANIDSNSRSTPERMNTVDKIKKYKVHHNGIIEPILPSISEEPLTSAINRFKQVRENAVSDYKIFTPSIQFEWAIILLESLSRTELISKMGIDGNLRKKPLPNKNLIVQRKHFLMTSIKVLEKLIEISPNATRSRLYLGDIYSGGIHPGLINRDEVRGYKLFYDSATKQNDPVSYYRVACCLEFGVGCKQSIEQSFEFFKISAELGDPSSMCQLGMLYFSGVNGIELNISKSIYWHEKAVESLKNVNIMGVDPLISARSFSDSRGSLYTLAKLYQTDLSILHLDKTNAKADRVIDELTKLNVFRNFKKSFHFYLEASKLGHSEAQSSLGFYFAQGCFPTSNFKFDKDSTKGIKTTIDPKQSVYWFSEAAKNEHVYAALGLAKWYGSGATGVLQKDEQQAFLWGRKAADEGQLAEAEFMIGVCFEQGFGTSKNLQLATTYYKRSADKGYKKAISKLKSM